MGWLPVGRVVMKPASGRGFTLVETVVALSLMSVIILAAAPMFIFAMKETAAAGDLGVVAAAAVDRMEFLRTINFNSLTPGGSLTSNVSGYSDTSDPDFTVRWQIADNTSPVTVKTIDVRVVASRSPIGRPKQITLSSMRVR